MGRGRSVFSISKRHAMHADATRVAWSVGVRKRRSRQFATQRACVSIDLVRGRLSYLYLVRAAVQLCVVCTILVRTLQQVYFPLGMLLAMLYVQES